MTKPAQFFFLLGASLVSRILAAPTASAPSPKPVPEATPEAAPLPATVFGADGKLDLAAYKTFAKAWDRAAVNTRFGPTFEALHPGTTEDDRPTNFKPPSKNCDLSFANRTNPYELGVEGCVMDNDYWSESGQVGYVPDDLANDPGLDRVQTFAYYNNVFALSPRLDFASGTPHPDPQTKEPNYSTMLGGHMPQQPIAMVRNYAMLQNEAIVIYRDGLLAIAGTQTSRAGEDRPFPGLLFPKNKVPTAIAVTTSNELALVTIWDTDLGKGQLAVVALEGKYLPSHTMQFMGMPNEGSFSALKLLGYIDLPFATPSSVAAATNSWWGGPSQTANLDLGQIDLSDEGKRSGIYEGDMGWTSIVATKGYALVASSQENKIAFVDLTPLMASLRESYLSSKKSFEATLKARGPGPKDFPQAFSENAASTPKVVLTKTIQKPTAVLAGLRIDRWSLDIFKAYVAEESGVVHIFDASSFMARYEWQKKAELAEIGSVKVGRNPVALVFTRHGDYPVPLIPNGHDGKPMNPDPLNNTFYVVCRGDREVEAVSTWSGKGAIYRRIKDKRMGDPVAMSVALRGNIVSIADYTGRKILSFRIGGIGDRKNRYYGAGADGKADYEFSGELSFLGTPFLINTTNVN